jgi:hypothetical protein
MPLPEASSAKSCMVWDKILIKHILKHSRILNIICFSNVFNFTLFNKIRFLLHKMHSYTLPHLHIHHTYRTCDCNV